jgi:PKD repeat protein
VALLLVATPASAAQVTLGWNAPTNGPTPAGYRLYYGTSSRTYTTSIPVGLQTSYTVTGLTAGQLYYFVVTDYDSTGTESVPSNEVSATTASAPVAAFSATPTSGPAPLAVTFTDASTGSITTWAWDFGDGSTSTLRQPTYTYTTPGTYTVKLTVSGAGGSTSATKTITVTTPAAPVAAFSATPTSGPAPLAVTFTDASTGSITTWAWDFGDGSTSTLRQPTHTYTTPGTYTVKLTVSGANGSNTATKAGYITVAPALVEVGNLTVDYVWKRITFRQVFVDPIVVATPLSSNDFAPATIRIRNIGPTGFEIRVQEWDYLDGVHLPETVSYLAMERGPHTLGTGIRVEAGRMTTNLTTKKSWAAVSFQQGFQVAPVVLTAVTSVNEADAVVTRVTGCTAQGFQVRMQEQLNNIQSHATESIDYIAWEPSAGTVDGLLFEVKTTPDIVTDQGYTLQFTEVFLTPPMFLADMQTTGGGDPATLRWDQKTQSQIVLEVQEEASTAHNLKHTTEVVGYMVFTYP